jgi:hypothetical protein
VAGNTAAHTALAMCLSLSSNAALPLARVLNMMQDMSAKSQRGSVAAEAQFRRLDRNGGGAAALEAQGVYAAALRTRKLNAIGVFNECGDELGFALSPVLAMVNHACLPNCQQLTTGGQCKLIALRDLKADEELSYSYISLAVAEDSRGTGNSIASDVAANDAATRDRQAALHLNWEFICGCRRCRGGSTCAAECAAFDAAHTCFCGSVCLEVDRASGGCVCNPPLAEEHTDTKN